MVHPITVIHTIGSPTCRGWHPIAGATRTVRRVRSIPVPKDGVYPYRCTVALERRDDEFMGAWTSYRQRLLSGCGLFLGFNDGGLRFARLLLECDHGSVDRTGLWVRLYPNCDQAVGFDPGLLCLSRPLREGVVRSGESLVTARRSRRAVFLFLRVEFIRE